ncbi:MAG: hypothetical protein JSR85_03695 [Proteobacteria bacterium]|nr:hypothetical protein [Pseudomonadota bacterium]
MKPKSPRLQLISKWLSSFCPLILGLSLITLPVQVLSMEASHLSEDVSLYSSSPSTKRKDEKTEGLFQFDFTKSHIAREIVQSALFLPTKIRTFFERSAEIYRRDLLLKYVPESSWDDFCILFESEFQERYEDQLGLSIEIQALIGFNPEEVRKQFMNRKKRDYLPFWSNIESDIENNGSENGLLFDGFFAHLLGVGVIYPTFAEMEQYKLEATKFKLAYEKGNIEDLLKKSHDYKPFLVEDLLQKLHRARFLTNWNPKLLLSAREFYRPDHQLERYRTSRKEPTTLIIGDGRIGASKIEPISRYGSDVLTIDQNPLQLPHITSNINDKGLLTGLLKHYRGKFNTILETSNIGNKFVILDEKTMECMIALLQPRGQLISRHLDGWEEIDRETAKTLIAKYDLKPIYWQGNPENPVVALEKKI